MNDNKYLTKVCALLRPFPKNDKKNHKREETSYRTKPKKRNKYTTKIDKAIGKNTFSRAQVTYRD